MKEHCDGGIILKDTHTESLQKKGNIRKRGKCKTGIKEK
jgi:hypothetical protein